jgi:hypothetical protein
MRQRWSLEELAKLEATCGDRPWPLVVQAYNNWAAQSAYPRRTSLALERKAQALGIFRRSEGHYITSGAISEILGLDRATPLRWIRRGLLPSWRNGEGRSYAHYVSRAELRRLARENPAFFRRYEYSRLVMLFDAPAVADLVYEVCPSNVIVRGRKRPVECVETGRRYDSIKAAARAAYVTSSRLWSVLDTNETANGLHWRSVTQRSAVGASNLTR